MTPEGTVGHKIKDKHIKDISGPPHKVQRASRLKTPTGAEPEVLELRCYYTPKPFISQTASSVRSSTVVFTSTCTSALSFTIPTLSSHVLTFKSNRVDVRGSSRIASWPQQAETVVPGYSESTDLD